MACLKSLTGESLLCLKRTSQHGLELHLNKPQEQCPLDRPKHRERRGDVHYSLSILIPDGPTAVEGGSYF